MSRSRVDLPQPDGPMSETNSPWRMVRSTDSSAVTAASPVPNTLPTPVASTTGARGDRRRRPGPPSHSSPSTGRYRPRVSSRSARLTMPDEDEADERAHDDRRPQPLRPGRVVLVVVDDRAAETGGDARRLLPDDRADDRRGGRDPEARRTGTAPRSAAGAARGPGAGSPRTTGRARAHAGRTRAGRASRRS